MVSDFWRDKRALVTGGTGLLGGALVPRLIDAGADVVCLIRDSVPQSRLHRESITGRIITVFGDVCDQDLMERTIGEYEIETVFHLAAQTIVTVANRNPLSTFNSNIKGTWTLLDAARRSPRIKSVIVASSDKAYGTQAELPYEETNSLKGEHPYDVSKSCADLIARSYAKTFGLPVAITRCGNLYGAGDLNWNRIVPGTIRSIIRGKRPIIRSDGTFVRDYFYIDDAAAAYMSLAELLETRKELRGEAFNFSNELQISALKLVETVSSLMGTDLSPVILNEATDEIKHQYLSAAKARRVLGWKPLFTLEAGLERTIHWYQDFFSA